MCIAVCVTCLVHDYFDSAIFALSMFRLSRGYLKIRNLQAETAALWFPSILWMDKIPHHFEAMVETSVRWYLQGNHHCRVSFLNGGAKWISQPSTVLQACEYTSTPSSS